MYRLKDIREPGDVWTFGTNGVDGRFGGALPEDHKPARATLTQWENQGEKGQVLCTRTVKCRSYREAVRVLRRHLKGY